MMNPAIHLPETLDDALVASLPPSCHYIPNFITAEEEYQILEQIRKTPPARWTNLSHRRLLSVPSALAGAARDTLLASPLPSYLTTPILPRLASLSIFAASPHHAPNHVLINEYHRGQGIMPHEDGPTYYPITATVSLGASIVLDVYEKNAEGVARLAGPRWRILQEPRSLLVTSGAMYVDTLHGIAEVEIDKAVGPEGISNWDLVADKASFEGGEYKRETRVSLTFRDVLKVTKVGGAIKFLGKK